MCTSPPPQHGLAPSTPCSNANCGSMPTSGAMGEDPSVEQWRPPTSSLRRVGTDLTRGERWQRVARISGPLGRAADQLSGVSAGPHRLRGCGRGPLANIRCSLRGSRLSLICSLHGCSSPTALQPWPLTSCACSHRPWCAGLLKITTMVCGVVSVSCWVSLPTRATPPLILGGLGLRSAVRTSESAYWASWADCLPMIEEMHPEVATEFVTRLEAGVETPCLGAAATAAWNLAGTHGFEPASWTPLALGARPPPREPDDYEPGAQRLGWQHEASSRVELQFRDLQLMPALSEGDRALVRSQSGGFLDIAVHSTHPPGAPAFSRALIAAPSSSPSLLPSLLQVWPSP